MVIGPMLMAALTIHGVQAHAQPVANGWVPMPLLTREARAAGVHPGGEGAQWPRGPVAVSPADPRFLLLPIDVGGLYRSLDGGRRWQIAMVGWNARGANAFAIDPRNPRRAIGVGGNSLDWNPSWGPSPHGLYLTTDQAASWRQTLALDSGHGGALAFDPRSYDASRGFCTVVYYLSPVRGVHRSDDGGATWARLPGSPEPGVIRGDWTAGGDVFPRLVVQPATGAVFVGGAGGLWRSDDRGGTWERVRESPVTSIATAPGGAVFVTGPERVARSDDGGRTWRTLRSEGLQVGEGQSVRDLSISPADPRRMLCWVAGPHFQWPRYVSWDGGDTWQPVRTARGLAPLPMNAREGRTAWHPANPNVAWSLGGDWVTRSDDGGRTFRWSNNGYAGVMVGGLFGFSAHAPGAVFLGFQDYNGALTLDGGATWTCPDVSGKGWGGHIYGGFTVDGRTLWGGDADSWGAPRRLRLSRDGGSTWTTVTGPDGQPLVWTGPDVSYADPVDPRILFASNWRSDDGGDSWRPMQGCDGVFTHGASTRALYGRRGNDVVRSRDHGATWERVTTVEGEIHDMAVDDRNGLVYVAAGDRLRRWQAGAWSVIETPRDQYGQVRIRSVAVDPTDASVIYAAGSRDIYASHATVSRSTDGGRTWRNLTVTAPLRPGRAGGPHEVNAIRVHPVTREAWAAGQCFGLWRIAPPAPGERGLPVDSASAPRAPTVPRG